MTVQPRVVSQETVQRRRGQSALTRYQMEYTVRNARSQPVVVEIRQTELGSSTEVSDQSIEAERRGDVLIWLVPVPANGETRLTATILTGN